jgi:hypothetical protein
LTDVADEFFKQERLLAEVAKLREVAVGHVEPVADASVQL